MSIDQNAPEEKTAVRRSGLDIEWTAIVNSAPPNGGGPVRHLKL